MENEELIKKIKPIDSFVDFYRYKPLILKALGDKDVYKELRDKLSKLPMKELRKIGDKYNAKDTSKADLIRELIIKGNTEEILKVI